jgi:hypothetical protein
MMIPHNAILLQLQTFFQPGIVMSPAGQALSIGVESNDNFGGNQTAPHRLNERFACCFFVS